MPQVDLLFDAFVKSPNPIAPAKPVPDSIRFPESRSY
jgi:hypothetical protein